MLRSRELSSTWATLDDPSRVTASYISTMPDCGHTVKSPGWVEGSAINQIMPRGAFPSREITWAIRSLWASWRRSDMGANASTHPRQGVRRRHASWSEAGCGEWHDMTPMLLPHRRTPPAHHRPADAHEPHQPTTDAHGTARPRFCGATASPAQRRTSPGGCWETDGGAACSTATASPATATGSTP